MTSAHSPSTPLLELRGLYKSFGPVQVLRDVDFSVYPGQVTALVGDNGAGKSTLVKCVSGIYGHDAGEFRFEGRPVTIHNPRDAATLGIEIVYQDLALCDNLDIVQNMFLGREKRTGIVLDDPTMEQLAAKTLASLAVRTVSSVRQRVASLTGGQRQRSPSPKPCCGTAGWSSSTNPPPPSAWPRRPRCSSWSAGWPTTAWPSCSSPTT